MPSVALSKDQSPRIGMWLFLFTDIILFGLLFIVYAAYRIRYTQAFHFATGELSVFTGTVNTIILLFSSATVAMSVRAIRQNNKRIVLQLLGLTFIFGTAFLIIRCFELGEHIKAQIYPASSVLALRGKGDVLYYGLYFFITGLHTLHVIIGLTLIGFVMSGIIRGKINPGNYSALETSGLYWQLVSLIWIFLFPLFYLIT
jgi:cytochrome c oxidase subunit 3